jgi:flagellar motor switch protein FliN/FliY
MSQEEIEKLMSGMLDGGDEPEAPTPPAPAPAPQPEPVAQPPQPAPAAAAAPTPPPAQQPAAPPAYNGGYPGYPAYPGYPGYPAQPVYAQPQPKVINTQPMVMQQFSATDALGEEQAQNLDLIMEIPLQVSVEIGRTRRKVQEILELSKGSLVVLDKLAGDQVDLFVNGTCIARGDVVVIEDNFGVRITEIVQKPAVQEIVKK